MNWEKLFRTAHAIDTPRRVVKSISRSREQAAKQKEKDARKYFKRMSKDPKKLAELQHISIEEAAERENHRRLKITCLIWFIIISCLIIFLVIYTYMPL